MCKLCKICNIYNHPRQREQNYTKVVKRSQKKQSLKKMPKTTGNRNRLCTPKEKVREEKTFYRCCQVSKASECTKVGLMGGQSKLLAAASNLLQVRSRTQRKENSEKYKRMKKWQELGPLASSPSFQFVWQIIAYSCCI